tara:strand:+ start:7021 stop:7887 length:867 start_codon:yes stop_codon:yes gene_type:complete
MYKYKLKEIEVGDTEIRGGKQSTVSAIDDATGRIEWDIVDAADFSSVYKSLLKAKDFLSTLEKEGKAKDDVVIDGFAEDMAKLFNAFRTHVRKAYPKEYERVSRLKEIVVSDNESPSLKAKIAADDFIYQYRKALRIVASNSGNEAAEEFKNIVKLKISQLKEEEVEEGEGIGYLTPNAFGKNKKNIYTSQYGYKLVPKKIKGAGTIVKQLFEYNDFQEGRIRNFDAIEDKINSILPMISNAKNKTAEYYNENPGSYNINYPTDAILKELDDVIEQLKQANEDISKSI